jgi:dihydrofolate synthase / folylpolyglutamate synthase
MTYQQTLDHLYAQLPMFHRIGAAAYKADLDNTLAICELLGHPEKKFKSIHVAGTNGKGSSSHMLAAIFQKAGYKTGLYTSPHLKDFRERIKINGKAISKKNVTDFVQKHRAHFEKIQPSFFEWTVGLAFDHFAQEEVDIAIIEVGLGGRLDSTNVITPLASLITNIGFDHTALLGKTLKKIAAEKAGIIKPGIPVIISQTQTGIKNVFVTKARASHSSLYFADQIYKPLSARYLPQEKLSVYSFKTSKGLMQVGADLTGTYQAANIAGVLATIDVVQTHLPVKNKAVVAALKQTCRITGLHGRWEILQSRPRVICDTGHNADGIREVIKCVTREYLTGTVSGRLHVVFGAVNDKDVGSIFSIFKKNKHFARASYYFCKPQIPRGMETTILLEEARKLGLKGKAYPSVKKALAAAKRTAKKHEMVFVGGSTFTVAEVV